MKPNQWDGGKGDDSRISDFRKYQESPIWDNLKANKEKANKEKAKKDNKDYAKDPD